MAKRFRYNCVRCFYTVDNDEEKMIKHCLLVHGVTGKFKKGYKTKITRTTRIKKEYISL